VGDSALNGADPQLTAAVYQDFWLTLPLNGMLDFSITPTAEGQQVEFPQAGHEP
jgi:hypothetical protein